MNGYIYRFLVGEVGGGGSLGVRAQAPVGNIALAKRTNTSVPLLYLKPQTWFWSGHQS